MTRASSVVLTALRLTLLCWLVTSPVVAHHFQRISLVAPLANLLAAPLVSAVVVTGLAALILLPVAPAAAQLPLQLGAFLSDLVIRISAACAALPLAATTTPSPSFALTAALTALALVLLLPRTRATRIATAALVTTAVVLTVAAIHDRYRSDRLDVWFASVGQGDGAIVRQPGGKVWVVDAGPPGRGRMVIGPLLRRAWIGRVDVLVASHVQSDHSGALPEILEDFDVGELWLPDGPCANEAARRIEAEAAKRQVPVRYVSSETQEDHADVDILWPPPGAAACDKNDQSLVLSITHAGRRVLFTGDIEAAAEAQLVELDDLNADILKVPHHGSRTSSSEAFLAETRPALAVISAGLDNQFRHPAQEVRERYAAHAIPTHRTDIGGALRLTIEHDGRIQTEAFRERDD